MEVEVMRCKHVQGVSWKLCESEVEAMGSTLCDSIGRSRGAHDASRAAVWCKPTMTPIAGRPRGSTGGSKGANPTHQTNCYGQQPDKNSQVQALIWEQC
eukprot:5090220-Pyramimonas_sp.AAC.1